MNSILNVFMLALKLLWFFYLYQYQNLGVDLENLYNVMMDLTHDLKVRYKKQVTRIQLLRYYNELKRVNNELLFQIRISTQIKQKVSIFTGLQCWSTFKIKLTTKFPVFFQEDKMVIVSRLIFRRNFSSATIN